VDRLIDVIVSLQRQLEAARQRIEELEKKLGGPGAPTPAKVDQPFSVRAEEKRQRDRNKNKLKLYFVYIVGLSFDKVCLALKFLQNLPLGKTQAHTLLQRLAKHWQNEFEVLCTLLANSLVVHTDETSWSINSMKLPPPTTSTPSVLDKVLPLQPLPDG
jgi:uncharacterized protein YigA (DUF484 family)